MSVPAVNLPQFCSDQFRKLTHDMYTLGGVPEMGT